MSENNNQKNKKLDNLKTNINPKKNIIMILVISAVFITGTFAWLSWRSNDTSLVLTVGDINNVQVVLKPYQINTTVTPVLTYENEEYTNVTATNNSNTAQSISLKYKINNIDTELVSTDFKYTVTKSTDNGSTYTEYLSGDFSTASSGSTVEVLSEEVPANTVYNYKVYVWLEGTSGDQSEAQGKTVNMELGAEIITTSSTPSAPVLDEGMIPVKIADDGTATTVSSTDSTWYNYDNKQWANIVLVDEAHRNDYLNTEGVTVNNNYIIAYFVWIPRYKYAMKGTKCSDITDISESTNSECYSYIIDEENSTDPIEDVLSYAGTNYNQSCSLANIEDTLNNGVIYCSETGAYISLYDILLEFNDLIGTIYFETTLHGDRTSYTVDSTPTSIDIVFEDKDTPKSLGTAIGTDYRTHPAFTFGTKELDGIWVSKFEDSYELLPIPNREYSAGMSIYEAQINEMQYAGGTFESPSCDSTMISNALGNDNESIGFEGNSTFGLTAASDSHAIKNSEWGAVAYLSHSKYGINGKIRINSYYSDSSQFMTGCGALSVDTTDWTCDIPYGSKVSNYPQSTTGNISGIFDMVGGEYEYVMGVLTDDNGNILPGSSGYSGYLADGTFYSGICTFTRKYYDLYTSTDMKKACNGGICYGHALSETASWYSANSEFISNDYTWLMRGTYIGNAGEETMGIFDFVSMDGNYLLIDGTDYMNGTRGVIVDATQ